MNVEIQSAEQVAQSVPEAPRLADVQYQHADFDAQSAMAFEDPEALALAPSHPVVLERRRQRRTLKLPRPAPFAGLSPRLVGTILAPAAQARSLSSVTEN